MMLTYTSVLVVTLVSNLVVWPSSDLGSISRSVRVCWVCLHLSLRVEARDRDWNVCWNISFAWKLNHSFHIHLSTYLRLSCITIMLNKIARARHSHIIGSWSGIWFLKMLHVWCILLIKKYEADVMLYSHKKMSAQSVHLCACTKQKSQIPST